MVTIASSSRRAQVVRCRQCRDVAVQREPGGEHDASKCAIDAATAFANPSIALEQATGPIVIESAMGRPEASSAKP
jgi:hypothetical protein